MTDARLPGRWLTDPRMDRLSDPAWRGFTRALMYAAEHGTDGRIDSAAMRYVCPESITRDVLAGELRDVGLILTDAEGWQLLNWSTDLGQSTAAEVATRRANNRERQAKHRTKAKGGGQVTRDVTRDAVGEDRQGEDRAGEDVEPNSREPARKAGATLAPIDPDGLIAKAQASWERTGAA